MDCDGLLSSTSSATEKQKLPLKWNRRCHFCGESANPDTCVTCCICKVAHVHLYCLHKKVGTVPDNWYCEECKGLSRFQQKLPDHLAIHTTWKGSFEILNPVMGGTYEGLQAHLPRKGRCKAYKVANAMPDMLQLKLHPRSDVWPEKFDRLSPTDDDISLYFLPNDKRFGERYQLLTNVLEASNSALQTSLDGWELLIFPSTLLHTDSQRIEKHFFLWGVFQTSERTQHESVSSALCNNDYRTNNGSLNIIEGVDSMEIKRETDCVGDNNGERTDKAALSNSNCRGKKRKVGGSEGPLITPKSEQPDNFESPPGFMTPIICEGYVTSPALLLEAPSGFLRSNTTDGYSTSSASLLEAPPGFCMPIKPKERGDSSDETTKKLEVSETMAINAHWSSKRQRSARGTATSKYFHDSSFQPQKPTKFTKSPELDSQYCQQLKMHEAFKVRDGKSLSSCNLSMLSRLLSSHGTTIVGLGHPNFGVVLGVDGKATAGDQLIRLDDVKIYDFGDGAFEMWGASAGTISVCDKVAGDVHQIMQDAGNHIDKIHFLCEKMIHLPGDWGKEQKGDDFIPFLLTAKNGESDDEKEFYCCGSGAVYALKILDCIPCVANLEVKEAKVWVERALLYAAINDHYSGGKYYIETIRADRDTETDTECILTDLWRKHKNYFIQRFKDLGESDIISKRVMDFRMLTKESKKKWMECKDIFIVPRYWNWPSEHFVKKKKVKEPAEVPDDNKVLGDYASMLEEFLQDNKSDDDEGSHDEDERPLKKQKPN